jgi:hypothetical protein
MLNYMKKFALEILPSVAATVIGAYIVNHYISNKAAVDAPVAAAVSPADVKKVSKPADAADVASIPEHGITAKGISERAMMEKSASERPGEFKPSEVKSSEAKSSEVKPEAKPSETASAPAKHPTPAASPKAIAKTAPAPAASPAAPVETASAPAEDHRDANDLARAAIERLRKEDGQSHTQEASRAPDAPRLQEAPRTVPPAPPMATASIRPLPPPITVVAPPVEGQGNIQGNMQGNMAPNPAPYTASIRTDDPNRPTPPADIPPPPPAPPIDLRADATNLATRTNNMAQDVLARTKSMFHALIPGRDRDNSNNGQSSSASQFTD